MSKFKIGDVAMWRGGREWDPRYCRLLNEMYPGEWVIEDVRTGSTFLLIQTEDLRALSQLEKLVYA